jgi:hypothetical protein
MPDGSARACRADLRGVLASQRTCASSSSRARIGQRLVHRGRRQAGKRAARTRAVASRTKAEISSSGAPGWKTRATPASSRHLLVVVGHDAADDHRRRRQARLAQRAHQLRHDQVVGRERADADHVDVLLERELDDRWISCHGGV